MFLNFLPSLLLIYWSDLGGFDEVRVEGQASLDMLWFYAIFPPQINDFDSIFLKDV